MRRVAGAALGLVVATAGASACTLFESLDGYSGGGEAGLAVDGALRDGPGGEGSSPGPDGGPNPCSEPAPSNDSSLLTDKGAVFVAGDGADINLGSSQLPVATLHRALDLARSSQTTSAPVRRIFVCAGTYDEPVKVDVAVSLYGGLTCSSAGGGRRWAYSGAETTLRFPADSVVSGSAAVELTIRNVLQAVSFQDLTLDFAPIGGVDGGPGPMPAAMVGALVVSASAVGLCRVEVRVPAGGPGAAGTTPRRAESGRQSLRIPDTQMGRHGAVNVCSGGTSTGGTGGSVTDAGVGQPGAAGLPARGGGAGGAAEMSSSLCPDAGIGGTGGDGLARSEKARGGSASFRVEGEDFIVEGAGTTGSRGDPGQGGGGGGALTGMVGKAGGGGGSSGGCGGAGGGGGAVGGSGLAIVVTGAALTLESCTLSSGPGGPGGRGAPSGPPGAGGALGIVGVGCPGGAGGSGGPGGPGGGGAGGSSIGIAYQGLKPQLDSKTTIGVGAPGAGGLDGEGMTTGKGGSGISAKVFAF